MKITNKIKTGLLLIWMLNFTACDCPQGYKGSNCNQIDLTQIQYLLDQGVTPNTLYDKGVSLEQLYGKTYLDGLIFYVNTSDGTGLVAAISDQRMGSEWGCNGTDIEDLNNVGSTPETGIEIEEGARIGDGVANTNIILENCTDEEIAAKACRNLGEEWFLPSRGELRLIYTNLHLNEYGDFSDEWYFSSTENTHNTAKAIFFNIELHYEGGAPKSVDFHVRAAKKFNN